MKCINQSKQDMRIQAKITNDDDKKHLITYFFNSSTLPIPHFEITKPEIGLKIKVEKSKKPFEMSHLPKLKLIKPESFDINNTTPTEVLSLIPLNKDFDHSYTHLVSRYCYYNNLSFETFISWYIQKNDTAEAVSKWRTHWNNLTHFDEVKRDTILSILVKYYPTLRRHRGYEIL